MEDGQRQLEKVKRKRLERKKRRQKAIFTRLAIFFVFVAAAVFVVLSLTVLFPIDNIVVRTPEPYTAQQISENSGIVKGQNLWLAGNNANEKITQALPYVSSVKIKRKLPSTIIITVQKAEASVCYQTADGFYICDENNKLLEIKNESAEDIVLAVGCDIEKTSPGSTVNIKNSENYELFAQLKNGLEENGISVSEIDVTDTVDVTFKAEGRFKVKLGSAANITDKLAHLKEMVNNIDEDLVGEINLSYWTEESHKGIFTQQGSK